MSTTEETTNAVLATKLDFISRDISAIKKDVSDIKNDTITRREFEIHVRDSEEKVKSRFLLTDIQMKDVSDKTDAKIQVVIDKADFINKVLYSVVALVVTAIVLAGMKLILK